GLLDLTANIVSRHLVRLIDNDQIPVRSLKLGLQIRVARQVIQPGDEQGLLSERIATARSLDHVLGQDLEIKRELSPQLVLPLLDQAARSDDQAPLDVAPDNQLLAEKACHDRLACPWIIGKQVTKRLP